MTKKKSLTGQKTVSTMKVDSVSMLILISMRLKNSLQTACENNEELRKGVDVLYAERTTETADDSYRLKQAVQWMDIMLGGAMDDIDYISSHLRSIEAIVKLEAAIKKELKQKKGE